MKRVISEGVKRTFFSPLLPFRSSNTYSRSFSILFQFFKLFCLDIWHFEMKVVKVRMPQQLFARPPFVRIFVQAFLEEIQLLTEELTTMLVIMRPTCKNSYVEQKQLLCATAIKFVNPIGYMLLDPTRMESIHL